MKKGSIVRKLITSSLAFAFTAVCLSSTTYAWFAKNSEAWTEEFGINIQSYDNLSISIDGKEFGAGITNEEIQKAIVAKMHGIDIASDNESATPVLTDQFVQSEFAKIKLKDVTTTDCVNFRGIDSELQNPNDDNLTLTEASKYDYVSFDLYFKVNAHGGAKNDYTLHFVSDEYYEENSNVPVSYMKADPSTVKFSRSFTVGETEIESESTIIVNAADSMRLGVITDTDTYIYEPNAGLGSYAIEGGEGIYDPANNYMFQYVNSDRYLPDLLPIPSADGEALKNTEKNFNNKDISFGTLTPVDGEYVPIKITMVIWLEGMDSDYFVGVDVESIKCFFSFYKNEIIKTEGI